MSFLKNHPFPVEAHFENSTVLTFAIPKDQLLPLIPERLQLDTFEDKYGFIAIAMVQTKSLRPKGFPKFMGNDFFLIGYRIFVRYTTKEGKRLRGLYILKSETDKKKMEFLGNIFTHYNYTTTDIAIRATTHLRSISSHQSKFHVSFDLQKENIQLPHGSPFKDWKEARRYAGPLPFTFTVNSDSSEILIIEGVREDWIPKPLYVNEYSFAFLDSLRMNGIQLANAFEINNVPYYWKKGKIEQWK